MRAFKINPASFSSSANALLKQYTAHMYTWTQYCCCCPALHDQTGSLPPKATATTTIVGVLPPHKHALTNEPRKVGKLVVTGAGRKRGRKPQASSLDKAKASIKLLLHACILCSPPIVPASPQPLILYTRPHTTAAGCGVPCHHLQLASIMLLAGPSTARDQMLDSIPKAGPAP